MPGLGSTIRILRSAKRLSQRDLAERATISATYLSLIEAERRQPTPEVLERLATGLGVPVLFLFRQSLEPEKRGRLGPEGDVEERLNSVLGQLESLEDKLRSLSSRKDADAEVRDNPSQ